MGWSNGIGIGWPNATSGSTPPVILRSGWFEFLLLCEGATPSGWTEFVENVDWQTGQYVFSTPFGTRVKLGEFVPSYVEPAGDKYPVIGPAYNSCAA